MSLRLHQSTFTSTQSLRIMIWKGHRDSYNYRISPTYSHDLGVDLEAPCGRAESHSETTVCPVSSVSMAFKLSVAARLFGCFSSASPLIVCGCHHPYLTLDLSQNSSGHQRRLSPKAFLAVRVTIATGCCWGIGKCND